jgi:hypothetical protein
MRPVASSTIPGFVSFSIFLSSHSLLVEYLSSIVSFAYKNAPSGLVGDQATVARFPLSVSFRMLVGQPWPTSRLLVPTV